jgi:BirA family biotin operon repressor/biotin-[acetyl-CoA-carboxylase] ligase
MKWPNDVMVDGKKIAGILSEAITQGLQVKGVVLGFGINLAMSQEILDRIDQPATSLNLLIDRLVDRDEFLEKVVAQFFRLSNS